MDPLTALTIGSIVAGTGANIAGGLAESRQLYSPELEAQAQRGQALQDEAARQFLMEQRAQNAAQLLDAERANQQAAAIMSQQGGFSGKEQLNASLQLQDLRRAENQRIMQEQAKINMQRAAAKAQTDLALAQRKLDARGRAVGSVAGALGTAAVQGIGVAQQAAAMNRQQSYFDAMIQGFAQQRASQQAQAAASTALEMGMVGGLQPGGPAAAVGATSPVAGAPAYIPGVDYR